MHEQCRIILVFIKQDLHESRDFLLHCVIFCLRELYLESDEDVKLVAEKDLALPFAESHEALKENFH